MFACWFLVGGCALRSGLGLVCGLFGWVIWFVLVVVGGLWVGWVDCFCVLGCFCFDDFWLIVLIVSLEFPFVSIYCWFNCSLLCF